MENDRSSSARTVWLLKSPDKFASYIWWVKLEEILVKLQDPLWHKIQQMYPNNSEQSKQNEHRKVNGYWNNW